MLVQLLLKGIARDPITMMHVLILNEVDGERVLRIWIGIAEAEAILREVEKIKVPRPMTHDLTCNLLRALDARIQGIIITDMRDDTYFGEIELVHPGGVQRIDSRPSDAIALALRFDAPIYADEQIFAKVNRAEQTPDSVEESEHLSQWLENLRPEDFGKFKM
jgi:hypothetical protein